MPGRIPFSILIISALLSGLPLFADIIITKDDMVLNGIIIEDNSPYYIIFANNYGEFEISYPLIKDIYKTDSIESDIELLRNMGLPVNEEEIKINRKAGIARLTETGKEISLSSNDKRHYLLMLNFYYMQHEGKLKSVLPRSTGVSVSGEIDIDHALLEKYNISGIFSEISYLHAEEGVKSLRGVTAAGGPFWRIPVNVADYGFNIHLSAAAGVALFSIENNDIEKTAIKSSLTLAAGPVFDVYSVVISPRFRFNYIYDGYASMKAAGLSLAAGYRF